MQKILLLLLLTITFLFSSQMATVYSLDPNGDGFLSLRKSPKGKEIGRLYNGNKVKILSKSGKYYKVRVVSSGRVGYAHYKWIRTDSKKYSKKLHVIRIRSNDTLSVRKNAGINNKKIGALAYNATGIKKIKCKNAPSGKRWCKVSHPSIITGWAMAKYISSKKSSSSSSSYNEVQRQKEYKRKNKSDVITPKEKKYWVTIKLDCMHPYDSKQKSRFSLYGYHKRDDDLSLSNIRRAGKNYAILHYNINRVCYNIDKYLTSRAYRASDRYGAENKAAYLHEECMNNLVKNGGKFRQCLHGRPIDIRDYVAY